jgi:DNA-binding LacI/PurR family transcriptional regulator
MAMAGAAAGQTQIALIWSSVKQNLLRPVRSGIDAALAGSSYKIQDMHLLSDEPGQLQRDLPHFLRRVREDASIVGAISCFMDLGEGDTDALIAAGKPVVFIERPSSHHVPGNISFDHAGGAAQAAEALLELGRKKIGWVGPVHESGWAGGMRYDSLKNVLDRQSLPLATADCFHYDIEQLLATTGGDLDAIVYASDIQAIGGIRMLRSQGVDIPGKIAVVGFDDTEAARNTNPPLSSVRQPFGEAGKWAAEMLVRVLGDDKAALRDVKLPQQLVLRGSCVVNLPGEIIYEPGKGALKKIAGLL